MATVKELMDQLPQRGQVRWIGVRSARRAPMQVVEQVEAVMGKGLTGDRYRGQTGGAGKRQVTLVQYEHLGAIASMLGRKSIDPADLRRNIAVSGINLIALKGKQFRIGGAVFEYTGLCHPCSRMEETFGRGGYNAVRSHGGINARVIKAGIIELGAAVEVVANTSA